MRAAHINCDIRNRFYRLVAVNTKRRDGGVLYRLVYGIVFIADDYDSGSMRTKVRPDITKGQYVVLCSPLGGQLLRDVKPEITFEARERNLPSLKNVPRPETCHRLARRRP